MLRLATALALAGALTLAAPRAHATVVREISRAEMLERSDLVVRAVVVEQHSQWSQDGRNIVTRSRLVLLSYLKGDGASELWLQQMGGTVNGYTARVEGDGALAVGMEIVAFLHDGGAGTVYLTALAQSLYVVTRDPSGWGATVQRDLHGLTFAREEHGRTVLVPPRPESPEPLDHLEHDVRAARR